MAKKNKNFSMFNDPSFAGFTEKDWEEWRKNQDKIPEGTPPPICKGCLFQEDDGTWQGNCVIFDQSAQGCRINCGECEKKEP